MRTLVYPLTFLSIFILITSILGCGNNSNSFDDSKQTFGEQELSEKEDLVLRIGQESKLFLEAPSTLIDYSDLISNGSDQFKIEITDGTIEICNGEAEEVRLTLLDDQEKELLEVPFKECKNITLKKAIYPIKLENLSSRNAHYFIDYKSGIKENGEMYMNITSTESIQLSITDNIQQLEQGKSLALTYPSLELVIINDSNQPRINQFSIATAGSWIASEEPESGSIINSFVTEVYGVHGNTSLDSLGFEVELNPNVQFNLYTSAGSSIVHYSITNLNSQNSLLCADSSHCKLYVAIL